MTTQPTGASAAGPGLEPIAEVAKRGESDSLEFKSSARWNMRAGKRDDAPDWLDAVANSHP